MALLKLGLDIVVAQKGNGFEVVSGNIRGLGEGVKNANRDAGNLLGTVGKIGAALGGVAAAWKTFDFLKGLVTQGFAFNAQMQASRLSIAALIGAFGEVKDASGNAMNDLASRLEIASDLQQKLKIAALQTTATYEDMVQALQVGIGPALKAGFNTEQIVQFTKTVTQAASAIGLPMNQLGQEIRSLFAGDIGPDSRLANLLFTDVPRNRIKAYVTDLQSSGKFFDELQKRMASFAEAGEKAGDTMLGAWSNLKDAFQQALGEGTSGQFGRVTGLVKELTAEIVTFDAQGRATFNPTLVKRVGDITEAAFQLGSGLLRLTMLASPLVNVFTSVVNTIGGLASGIVQAVFTAIEAVNSKIAETLGGIANTIQSHPILARLLFHADPKAVSAGMRDFAGMFSRDAAGAGAFGEAFGKMKNQYFDKVAGAWMDDRTPGTAAFGSKTSLHLGGKPGANAAEVSRERQKELDTLSKINAESQKNISLGLLRMNVIRAETDEQKLLANFILKSKEIEIREHERIGEVMRLKHVSEIQRETALSQLKLSFQNEFEQASAEFQKSQDDNAKKTYADQRKQIDDAIANMDSLIEKSQDLTRSINEATVQSFRDALKKIREPFEQFYRSVGDGMKRAMATALDGGGIRASFDAFFKSVFDTVGENFAKAIDGWMTQLADAAAGQEWTGKYLPSGEREMKPRAGGASSLAKGGMLGLQAGSAAYGLYTNPAPKQGQNILSGAMSGAAIGASVGGPYAWATAIIGAFVGAIAGAFAPTEKGKNVKIYSNGGQVVITGMDSAWGSEKLIKSINKAIHGTAAKLDEIFLMLPTSALAALGNWRPDLSKIDVSGKADGKNWNEELDNYLKETLPSRVFDAYGGAISGALHYAGVTDKKIDSFTAYLKTLSTDEAVKAVSDYVGVLFGFVEIFEKYFGGIGSRTGKQRAANRQFDAGKLFESSVYANADRGPLAEFADISKRVGVLSQDFSNLTHEEQVTRGKQILELSNQFFQGIEQYLLDLRDKQRDLNRSVDDTIRGIDYDQLTDPKAQVEFMQKQQRRLYDELGKASSADEVNRIMQEITSNGARIYELLGKTPEAANLYKQQLEDSRKLANERYEIFHQNAQKMIDDAFSMVDAILKRLQGGLDLILPKFPGDEAGGDHGHDDGTGDGGTETERRFRALGLAAEGMTGQFTNGFSPSVLDATQNVADFSAALIASQTAMAQMPPPVNVTVNMGETKVDVQIAGSAERLIDYVAAQASNAAVRKLSTSGGQYARRAGMSGR